MQEKIVYITSKEDLKKSIREVLQEREKPGNKLTERLTRRNAAKFMEVSYQTMHNWTKTGLLKEHGIGKKKFYLRDELIGLMRNETIK